ncbi:MAG: hypothetical protein ACKPER_07930 [Dolichospermum sp.]
MLTTIAKRIQSRLSRSGVRVALSEIKEYLKINSDAENLSDSDIALATEYFTTNATQLTVINEESTDVDNANTVSIQHIDTGIDENEVDNEPHQDYPEQSPKTGGLVNTTKSELVANTAVNLGIELNPQDIENIADSFDAGSDDFNQTLEQVKGAIIAYVQHKIASNNQKIVNAINEISQVASDGFEENSQTLTNGLKQLNQQLVQQSTDFKSQLAGTLSRFKLPAAS